MQFLAFPIGSGKLEAFRLFSMASYRIVARPSSDNLEDNVYDVEEYLDMSLPDSGVTGFYWSCVETFYSLEFAEQYAQELANRRKVVKEYA